MAVGWLLYPRELFLGYVYEGMPDMNRSESYYKAHLEKYPHSKFAALRLVTLYQRMGFPHQATPILKSLMEYRSRDWSITEKYMKHLRDTHDYENLFQAELRAFRIFKDVPLFPKRNLQALLEEALQYGLWTQRIDVSYQIIQDLKVVSLNPHAYNATEEALDRATKNTPKVVANLEKHLSTSPQSDDIRRRLVILYTYLGQYNDALKVLNDGLRMRPNSVALLELRINVNEKLGRTEAMISDLEKLLSLIASAESQRTAYMMALASLYAKKGQKEKALDIYNKVLGEFPENREYWLAVFHTLVDMKRMDEAVAFLKKYLAAFGHDPEREKFLVHYYLYDAHDLTKKTDYLNYVKKYQDLDLAEDVYNAFVKEHQVEEALSWIETMVPLFPETVRIKKIQFEALISAKRYKEAIPVGDSILQTEPDDIPRALEVASLRTIVNDRRGAQELYENLAIHRPKDPEVSKVVGRELYFIGEPGKALQYIENAISQDRNDPESWFWLSEIYFSRDQRKEGFKANRHVLNLLEGRQDLTERQLRMRLKSEGRRNFDSTLMERYRKAKAKYPNNFDLRADLADLLLENRMLNEARREITDMEAQFPQEKKLIPSFEIRLAFLEKRRADAIRLLERVVQEQPDVLPYQLELGDAYERNLQWKKAIRVYEKIREERLAEPIAKRQLAGLHERYDSRIGVLFRLIDFGAAGLEDGGISYQTFLSEPWELKAESWVGRYHDRRTPGDKAALHGKLSLTSHHVRNFSFEAGSGFGVSPARETGSPFVKIAYHPSQNFHLSSGFEYRSLRVDIPQAVIAGNLEDRADFNWRYLPMSRIILDGKYEFDRNYLPDGARGLQHILEPAVSFVILKDPYLTLGYQYTFSELKERQAFLSRVPLIPKVRAHYLRGYIGHWFGNRFFLDAGGFIGEDTARNLHFAEGDLWGVQSSARVAFSDHFDLTGSYDFGREVLSGVGGETHQAHVNLSGHW